MLPFFQSDAFPLFLAPMALYTDAVYRQLCKERGVDVLVTEFIRADSIVHGVEEVWEGVDFGEEQRPVGVQIYGSSPETMARAATLIVERYAPDFIDINFGCPADKVTCKQAGSSMLLNLPLMEQVVSTIVKALPDTPVTAKIRTGWNEEQIVALEAGRRVENAGAQMLTIHGRTKEQGYRGDANWDIIAEVASRLSIPVVGNGNLRDGESVKRARDHYGVAGAMIGRAALGYPWIFRDIKHYLAHGVHHPPPTVHERWDLLIRFAELMSARPFRIERHQDIQWMRPKLVKLTSGMPGAKQMRLEILQVSQLDDLYAARERHLAEFADARVPSLYSRKEPDANEFSCVSPPSTY